MPKYKFEKETEIELPEGFNTVEEMIAKFSEVTGQVPTLQQKAALAAKFEKFGDPDTLEARMQALLDKRVGDAVAAAKAEGATKKQADAVGDKIVDQWNDLSPQQQIEYLTTTLGSSLQQKLDAMVAAKWTEAQAALGSATTGNQQQFDLLAKAVDLKLQNPDLDLKQVWGEMTNLAKADPDTLMRLALERVTEPKNYEKKIAEERAKWDAEAKTTRQAEDLKVLNGDSIQSWMKPKEERPSLNAPGGDDAMKTSILSKFMADGKITANQL